MPSRSYKDILDDICEDNCNVKEDCGGYCTLKEILVSMHPSPRLLIQIKCIEKFKFEESQRNGSDIGWQEASIRWVDEGFAKKFNDVYNEDMTFKETYRKTIKP